MPSPVACDDSYSTHFGQPLTVAAGSGVLANDSGGTLTAAVVSYPSHGMLSFSSNGGFTYYPTGSYVGTDTFTYQANDGTSNSNTATVTLSLTDTAPVAVNDSYTLHGMGLMTSTATGVLANDTDADGDPLTAALVSGASHGSVFLSSNGSFSYSPGSDFTGTDSFTYQANDGALDSNTATVTITGHAPVANNDSYTLNGSGLSVSAASGVLANDTDADGDPLTAALVSGASHGSVFLSSNGSFSYSPGSDFTGTDSFTYQANDGALDSNTATVTISAPVLSWVGPTFTWSQSQAPPVVTNPGDQSNAEGDSVSLQIAATDPGNCPLSYDAVNLPAGLAIDGGTGLISGTIGYQAAEDFGGSYDATVLVTDAQGGSASAAFTWTVSDTPRVPVVTQPSDQANAAGDVVSVQVSATQPDGDPLSYDASGLPSGLDIDSDTGLISGTIDPSAASASAYSVTVTVTDSTPATPQTASATFSWTVGAATPSPALDNPGDQVNAAGDSVDLSLSAGDGGGYALTYLVSGLPAGLSADPGSGEITGTIANAAVRATPYTVSAVASDGQASSSQTFHWTVGGVSPTSPGDQQNLDGAAVALAVTASDVANNPLTYGATGLPAGLSIDSGTGVISGTLGSTADAASPYSVTVTATDGTYTANVSFSWEVDPLALDSPGDQQALEGTTVALQLSASDLVGTPSFSATGLPGGLSLNAATGLIAGTIGSAAHGQSPYQVTVTATDGAASSSQSFVWTVTPQVVLVSPGSQDNAAGDGLSLAVTASDRANNILSYAATGLPSGLGIDATTGVISGTIDAGAVSASPYSVTVTASDGTYSSSQTFPWTVTTLVLAAPGDQSNLDDDAVSLPLTPSYHGSGTLSYGASALPDGLSINAGTGLISGTLTNTADADGPYAVTVTASDGSASASQSFTWAVAPRVTVDAIGDQANVPGDTVSLIVSASDAASGAVTLAYSAGGLPAGLSIDSGTGIISGAVTAGIGSGPYAVTVTAGDGTASASQTFHWSVVPVVLSNPGDQVSGGGATVSLGLSADVIAPYTSASFSASGLPAGLSIDSSAGVIGGTLAVGDTGQSYLVSVAATADGGTSSQSFTWRVGAVVVTAPADQADTEGDGVSLAVSAWAASGTLSYSASGLPAGLSIDASSGVISGTIGAGAAAAGPYTVTVAAGNGTAADSGTFNWTINPRVVVNAIADQTNAEGDSVAVQVTASEPGATLSYSETGLPDGLSIDSSTGLISGTVASGAAADGPFVADIAVSDGTYSAVVEFGWTVTRSSNNAPVVANPGTQVNVVGDSVYLALSASDANGDVLTFSATGLPEGLCVDSDAGSISGTVSNTALYSAPSLVTLTADDGMGGTATTTFLWIVNDSTMAVAADPISATEATNTGEMAVASFTDLDPDWLSDDFTATIAWGDGTSDPGIVDGSDGSFTVSGSHVYAHPGNYPVQVSVTDGFQTVVSSNTATVSPAPITVAGGLQVGAMAGSSVSGTWATFDDANPTEAASSYTAVINWGDGSTASTGTVTGDEGRFVVSGSHSYSSAGAYTVTVMVTDTDGTSGSDTSTVQVGDIFAGVKATLTVASFTSNDPSATASEFTASVNWGDGSAPSTGTVTESGGAFTVLGSHTYAVDSLDETGGAYQVTVTVSSEYCNSLTHTTPVHVERPAIQEAAQEITGQAGMALTDIAVATFTEPDLSDAAGEFGASIDWGDGSAPDTGATVSGSGGVFQVYGSHTYSTFGAYQVRVEIAQHWSALQTASILLTPVVIGMNSYDEVKGPGSVIAGGNYTYSVWFDSPVTDKQIQSYGTWKVTDFKTGNAVTGYKITRAGYYGPKDKYIGVFAEIDFPDVNKGHVEVQIAGLEVNGIKPYLLKVNPVPCDVYIIKKSKADFQKLVALPHPKPKTTADAIENNKAITAFYANMYQNNNDLYEWSGWGMYVSYGVGQGMSRIKLGRMLLPDAEAPFGPGKAIDQFLLIANGNAAIYSDLAWQYKAYKIYGFGAIKANKASIDPLMYEAWEMIEKARRMKEDGASVDEVRKVLWPAQVKVAQHEQLNVLQPLLDRNKALAKQAGVLIQVPKPLFPEASPPLTVDFSNGKQRFEWVKDTFVPSVREYFHYNPEKVRNFMWDRIKEGG